MPMLLRNHPVPRRRGVVLLAVLLIVVVLSLAAYQYGEWVTSEFQAANAYTRTAQAHALAESGVHYVAAMLASSLAANASTSSASGGGGAAGGASGSGGGSSTSTNDPLNGNPWDNPQIFQNVVVTSTGPGPPGVFSIVGLVPVDDPTQASQPYRFGLVDEAGKININALLDLDNGQGVVAYNILMALPNMTDDVANSILDWLDPDDTPRTDGAEDDYYSSLPTPYHCKNGPLDSLEELLLIKGVTPQMVYGNDRNRNGVLDPEEDDGSGQVDLGWSAYLTVYSHEPNTDVNGNPRIYLNDPDIDTLANNLTTVLGQDMANYIIAYRLYGAASTAKTAPGGAGAAPAASAAPFKPLSGADADTVQTSLQTARTPTARSGGQQKLQKISSLLDLVNSSVNVPNGTGPNAKTISLPSPLNDPGQLPTLLPLVLDETTTTMNTDLTPRVNINTAPETVLQALTAALSGSSTNDPSGASAAAPTDPASQLTDEDIQNILSTRPDPSLNQPADPIFQTPAWLLTEANLPLAKLKALEPYITARSQVYHFQSIGYFQGGAGPVARIEAIIDVNNGKPRIIYERDLASLGAGFDVSQLSGQ